MAQSSSSSQISKRVRGVPVSARALTQRLGRLLVRDGKRLKKTRAARARSNVGDYYILNDRNVIVSHHVNLEAFGRKTGALADYERLDVEE